MSATQPARRDSLAEIGADDLVDRIAKEIGKTVAAHIEAMYPEAAKAVAWKSCARSIEGTVRNKIEAAGKAAERGEAEKWLTEHRARRIREARMWRDLRRGDAETAGDGGRTIEHNERELAGLLDSPAFRDESGARPGSHAARRYAERVAREYARRMVLRERHGPHGAPETEDETDA